MGDQRRSDESVAINKSFMRNMRGTPLSALADEVRSARAINSSVPISAGEHTVSLHPRVAQALQDPEPEVEDDRLRLPPTVTSEAELAAWLHQVRVVTEPDSPFYSALTRALQQLSPNNQGALHE